MNSYYIITVPVMGALLAVAWPGNRTRPWLLPIFGLGHLVLSFWLLLHPPELPPNAWLGYDPLARAVLPAVSLLFLL